MAQILPKSKSNLTFSEALFLLSRKEYKMMRYKNSVVGYEGPFYHFVSGSLCTTIGANEEGLKYGPPITFDQFTIGQLTECCWHVSSPSPPEGWFEMNYPRGELYKPIHINCWVNIFYDYAMGVLVYNLYKEEESAKKDAKDVAGWTFIKTCFLQQKASIPWKNV